VLLGLIAIQRSIEINQRKPSSSSRSNLKMKTEKKDRLLDRCCAYVKWWKETSQKLLLSTFHHPSFELEILAAQILSFARAQDPVDSP